MLVVWARCRWSDIISRGTYRYLSCTTMICVLRTKGPQDTPLNMRDMVAHMDTMNMIRSVALELTSGDLSTIIANAKPTAPGQQYRNTRQICDNQLKLWQRRTRLREEHSSDKTQFGEEHMMYHYTYFYKKFRKLQEIAETKRCSSEISQ